MAHISTSVIPTRAGGVLSRTPKRRGPVAPRAQFGDFFDPNGEAQRPLGRSHGDNNAPRFFAVDGHPPPLEQDWRLFRANLVAREATGGVLTASPVSTATLPTPAPTPLAVRPASHWAHTIPRPEPGCLLIARRFDLGMFSHSVVLVTEHDDISGTSALVLNMPTPLCIANLGLEEDITAAFGRSALHIGGPMNRNLLHILHGRGDVEGSMRIVDGLYAGGVEAAAELVTLGLARPGEFKLLAGYSSWGPRELEEEIKKEIWYVVAAGHGLVLDCLREPTVPVVGGHGASPLKGDAKMRCWQRVLDAAGIQP